MKKTILILAILAISLTSNAQDKLDEKYLEKVKTIDATLETLYSVISGPAGQKRNWELFNYLFKPEAKLIPSGVNQEGVIGCRYLSPEGYIESSGNWLVENGFFEKEVHRETQTFSSMTHVFSTYESFRTENDTAPFMRGINSIQLLNDGTRWWIINIYWTAENEANPLPSAYLGN